MVHVPGYSLPVAQAPSPLKRERVTTTIILGESLADVPLGKYVVVRVWVGDKPDENGSDVRQVFALKAVRYRQYTRLLSEAQQKTGWKRPITHREAIREGWQPAWHGESNVIVPIVYGDSDDADTAAYSELGECGRADDYGTDDALDTACNVAARLVPTIVYEAHKNVILKELEKSAKDRQAATLRKD